MSLRWRGVGEGLTRTLIGVFDWVEGQPAWLRPALVGAGIIYAFALARGGLVVLPLLVVVAVFWHLTWAFRLLICVLIIAPAGGFLGGLAYSSLSPVARRIGRAGRVLQYVAAGFLYALVLEFAVIPLGSPSGIALPQRGDVLPNLVIAGVIGLFGGVALSSVPDSPKMSNQTNWAFVGGVLLVGGVLALAMYLAGWTS